MTEYERIIEQRRARVWRQQEVKGAARAGRRHKQAIERRDQVLGFMRLGLSQREIAMRVGISQPAVLKIIKKWVRIDHLLSD